MARETASLAKIYEPFARLVRLISDRLNQHLEKSMNSQKTLFAAVALSLALTAQIRAEDAKLPPASTKTGITYATDIKPIFDANCARCHNGEKAKAKLHMDTLDGILKGTKMGSIIKVGDSADSFLVKVIAHTTSDRDEWMPPMPNKAGAKTLTPEQIGLVRAWIDQGAK